MFCPNCGKQLPEGVTVCPDCSPAAPHAEATPVTPAPTQPKTRKAGFKAPAQSAKNYAAIFTALLVFPATLSVAIDLSFHRYDYWCGYVIGAVIVTWVCAVLPVMRITPPAVTALICFGAILCYIFYIASKLDRFQALKEFWMPMTILTAAMIAITVALVGGKHIEGLHILSLIAGEAAIYMIALEALLDHRVNGAVELRWSLILASGFIAVIAVLEAFNYVFRTNRK